MRPTVIGVDDAGGGRRGLRPTLTADVASAIAATWDCDMTSAVELGGSTGLNLLAVMADRRVVVRVHRAHVTAARVEALQLARRAVAEEGVPTGRPIIGRDGERCVTVGTCVIEVEEFVASDNKMDSLDRIRRAMPTFARVHDALRSAALPEAAADDKFVNYVSARETTARTIVGAQRIRALHPDLNSVATAAERLADDIEAATGTTLDALPLQWCHGDYWDDNVLFRGDDIVLVADFGFMGLRPRVDDLALTLYFTLWELVAAAHSDPVGAVVDLVAAYDTGTLRPLGFTEREALPLALARQPLWSIGVWAAELDDADTVAANLHGHDRALTIGLEVVGALDHWKSALRR